MGILQELQDETLKCGSAVGATWKNLVANGYVTPSFGPITSKGIEALKERKASLEKAIKDDDSTMSFLLLDEFVEALRNAERIIIDTPNAFGLMDSHYMPAQDVRLALMAQMARCAGIEEAAFDSDERSNADRVEEAQQLIAAVEDDSRKWLVLEEDAGLYACPGGLTWKSAKAQRLTLAEAMSMSHTYGPDGKLEPMPGVRHYHVNEISLMRQDHPRIDNENFDETAEHVDADELIDVHQTEGFMRATPATDGTVIHADGSFTLTNHAFQSRWVKDADKRVDDDDDSGNPDGMLLAAAEKYRFDKGSHQESLLVGEAKAREEAAAESAENRKHMLNYLGSLATLIMREFK